MFVRGGRFNLSGLGFNFVYSFSCCVILVKWFRFFEFRLFFLRYGDEGVGFCRTGLGWVGGEFLFGKGWFAFGV